jgi:hypothetical protein
MKIHGNQHAWQPMYIVHVWQKKEKENATKKKNDREWFRRCLKDSGI